MAIPSSTEPAWAATGRLSSLVLPDSPDSLLRKLSHAALELELKSVANLLKLNFGDVLYPLLIPLGVFVGRYITYFGQTGELIFTEQGITVKDGDKEAFKAWGEYKIYIHLDGYIEQKVNGKKREGNRNYVEIATSTGTEKHFFQIFGKKQLDYLLEQLKPLKEDRLLKIAS